MRVFAFSGPGRGVPESLSRPRAQMRAIARKCGAGKKLFLPLNLSVIRSDLYGNSFDYNQLHQI